MKLHIRIPTILFDRKISVAVGAVVIFLVSIDLLMSRQILPYTNNTEVIMFILTVIIGYGIGSWILLGYTKRVSKEIRAKSSFINSMHRTVTIIQFSLFAILLFVLFSNTTGFLSPLVFAASSATACFILGVISFKFFSWYKLSNNKNLTVLLYGLAAVTLAISIAEDVGTKLLMIQVIQEKSPPGAVTQSIFVYKPSKKYNADIEYKVINPHITTLYLLPNSNLVVYNYLNSIVLPIAFVFRWFGSIALLRSFYHRIGKLPISFWIVLSLPLLLYLVGKIPGFTSGESMTGVAEPYRYFFRILYRGGTIAGNILFGLAFFIVARSVNSLKVKDYLIITGLGFTLVGISLSTSALQQTYGIAAHSLVLLSSYLFSIGLYVSALSVSQDSSLRKSIRTSKEDLLYNIGSAEMGQQIENTVRKVIQNQQKELEQQTGGFSHKVGEDDMKEYMQLVIEERDRSTISGREESLKTIKAISPSSALTSPLADAATPTVAETGTPNTTIEGLVKNLRSAGATVQVFIEDPSERHQVIVVNGENLQVFEYEHDKAAADAVAKRLVLERNSGYTDNAARSVSHTYRSSNVVVQYPGHDTPVLDILERVLGKEVIEWAMSADKDFEVEAKRLAKEMEERETKQHDN
jgi:hypothetical protein